MINPSGPPPLLSSDYNSSLRCAGVGKIWRLCERKRVRRGRDANRCRRHHLGACQSSLFEYSLRFLQTFTYPFLAIAVAMAQTITLHSHSSGPNPWKVAILMEELGLKYRHEYNQIADVKKPQYERLNPNGRCALLCLIALRLELLGLMLE